MTPADILHMECIDHHVAEISEHVSELSDPRQRLLVAEYVRQLRVALKSYERRAKGDAA